MVRRVVGNRRSPSGAGRKHEGSTQQGWRLHAGCRLPAECRIPAAARRSQASGSWERTLAYFHSGLDALGIHYEYFNVPYESGSLRALYLPGPAGSETKPLLMVVGGFDSILEELYPVLGKAANDRGYSILLYEGPGQGEALRKYGLRYTAEWEKPNTAMLDEFLRTHAKPSKIVLIGMSMGGYSRRVPPRSKTELTV